jgi:hypothetical protein
MLFNLVTVVTKIWFLFHYLQCIIIREISQLSCLVQLYNLLIYGDLIISIYCVLGILVSMMHRCIHLILIIMLLCGCM